MWEINLVTEACAWGRRRRDGEVAGKLHLKTEREERAMNLQPLISTKMGEENLEGR